MHFTLWPALTATEGGHLEIEWPAFIAFVAAPQVAENKAKLEGWSPARLTGNRRKAEHVELVSALLLDDDSSKLSTDKLVELWSDVAGVIHTSHSHTTEHPKHRIALRVSRDMTADEHARVWRHVRDIATAKGQALDEVTRDPSRLWYVPAHRADAPYAWRELSGEPLDVDAILASSANLPTPATARRTSAAPTDRRHAMAVAIGSAWPAKGRHAAQLALAGALRAEGFAEEEAVEFLCTVCRTAGDEDRSKRELTVRHTWGKPPGAAITGWTRLKDYVDPVVVDAARAALSRDAEWTEKTERRLAELQATNTQPGNDTWGVFDWNVVDPPVAWVVGGIIQEGTVNLAFGPPNSLKTWTLYLMASAVAGGEAWLGRGTGKGLVIILDYESSPRQARRRMRLLKQHSITSVRYVNPEEMLDDPKLWERLAQLRPVLVIVDSLSRGMLGRDENDQSVATIPLDAAKRLARDCGAATVLIHHKNKGGREGHESARGSGGIVAAAEGWLEFLDFQALEGGTQRARLHCARLKESVPFEDVFLELSDEKGLIEVKEPPKAAAEETTEERLRAEALKILREPQHSNGIKKAILRARLHGEQDKRVRVVAALESDGVITEYREQRTVWVRLNPHVAA